MTTSEQSKLWGGAQLCLSASLWCLPSPLLNLSFLIYNMGYQKHPYQPRGAAMETLVKMRG